MRIAIIDLGTNTFNLLIADIKANKQYSIIFNDKTGVKLGKDGINKRIITPDAFQRALNGIAQHIKSINKFKAEKIVAIATSGIRSTQNGDELVSQIQKQFGVSVQIITGDKEAELIYRGVKQTIEFSIENILILDIGGGSNEFIIANKDGLQWKQSYNLGMARLLDKFNPSDPITTKEIEKVELYIDSKLKTLYNAVAIYKPTQLVGSSGTFDTIREMIIERKRLDKSHYELHKSFPVELDDYYLLHNALIKSTSQERLIMKGLEFVRVEMIVLASIFVKFIVQKLNIKSITQSSFALKEGMIDKIING
ncbi:MAG: hypothetical protein A2W99_05740 [Bacteroidetes bacterium GWF2_33_16]|nr:MAG: hypothetical protein A2X00_13155 [Bacteroidetes bacterium GWE2_32_14]OFY05188.1 MAG: hypothetical protein A2W99_05740 [Bacteroidetes bacterium GWF2_33_16]